MESSTPLISNPLGLNCLKDEYIGNANPNFLIGIQSLDERYESIRRIRGDGNCFFRAFIFTLCEYLVSQIQKKDTTLLQEIQDNIYTSKDKLVAIGYSEVAIESFWETFVEYLSSMKTKSSEDLIHDFQTEGSEAEYLVWYMRLLTAGYIKKHAEDFQPFIEGLYPGLTVPQFCASEVEPMGKECDQPQITALTKSLQIGVHIEYLDGHTTGNDGLQSYICEPEAREGPNHPIFIHLLYRPGHYDILYPRS